MIYIIGVGSSGRASLGKEALEIIDRSKLLVGTWRFIEEFSDFPGDIFIFDGALKEAFALVEERKRQPVAFLATGDPLLYGIGATLIKRFGRRNTRVIPNVSIVQEAFARIKESWEGVEVISLHGSGKNGPRTIDNTIADIVESTRCAIFTDSTNTPSSIAKALLERGLNRRKLYVFEALGTDNELITEGYPLEISTKKFNSLNLVLVLSKEVAGDDNLPVIGLSNEEFKRDGTMITSEEVRAVTLAKLGLRRGGLLWDIGAGSGSVSVEAARLMRGGAVFAIEKKPNRVRDIEANKKSFDLENLVVIKGEAPDALKGLPLPDSVFIGGGGAGLLKILANLSKRIKSGTPVVINTVTVESLGTATAFFKRNSWPFEMTEVNISNSHVVAELHLLRAKNPIFIIRGIKP